MNIVKWKAGIADEAWKVEICERDAKTAYTMLKTLVYILYGTEGRNHTPEDMLKDMSQMSGREIAQSIQKYIDSCAISVEKENDSGETV